METLRDLGEFGFIERFAQQVVTGEGVVKGIGDDTAVIDLGTQAYLLMTTDMLVEGTHFLRTLMTPQEIGRKALACSISDIAAMGGLPTYAVVSLGAPSNISVQLIEGIGEGVNMLANEYSISVVGGDTVKHEKIVINVALLGTVDQHSVVYRTGAKKGDVIFVTGDLGNSFYNRKHIHFIPRVREAQYLVEHPKPTAMMDVSDGLAGDLGHMLRQSHHGAVLDEKKIPLAAGATLHQALHDGEDFELLFTVNPKYANQVQSCKKFKFYQIGVITSGHQLYVNSLSGKKQKVQFKGFEHF